MSPKSKRDSSTIENSMSTESLLNPVRGLIAAVELDAGTRCLKKQATVTLLTLQQFDESLRARSATVVDIGSVGEQFFALLSDLQDALDSAFDRANHCDNLLTIIELRYHIEALATELYQRLRRRITGRAGKFETRSY